MFSLRTRVCGLFLPRNKHTTTLGSFCFVAWLLQPGMCSITKLGCQSEWVHALSQPWFVIEHVPDFKTQTLKRLGVHPSLAPEDPPWARKDDARRDVLDAGMVAITCKLVTRTHYGPTIICAAL